MTKKEFTESLKVTLFMDGMILLLYFIDMLLHR